MTALTVNFNSVIKLTNEQFYQLCQDNIPILINLEDLINKLFDMGNVFFSDATNRNLIY